MGLPAGPAPARGTPGGQHTRPTPAPQPMWQARPQPAWQAPHSPRGRPAQLQGLHLHGPGSPAGPAPTRGPPCTGGQRSRPPHSPCARPAHLQRLHLRAARLAQGVRQHIERHALEGVALGAVGPRRVRRADEAGLLLVPAAAQVAAGLGSGVGLGSG